MSRKTVLVAGAGIGGLTAAVSLARQGYRVRLFEARASPGGLASSVDQEGLTFDGGPYILLDRPGLEWAFEQIGRPLGEHVELRRIQDVYEVRGRGQPPVRISSSLEETSEGMEREWPGSGQRYRSFVDWTWSACQRLRPLLQVSRPGPASLLKSGGWRDAPFLLRSLSSVLAASRLPAAIQMALGIWTHVAGQGLDEAPSALAFVPGLIHNSGAWYPRPGVGEVPRALARIAADAGVEIDCGARVAAIICRQGRAIGLDVEGRGTVEGNAVVSNLGLATYLDLAAGIPRRAVQWLGQLPLQSPGVCAYLAVRGEPTPPYLRFFLPGNGELCRLWVRPAVVDPASPRAGWSPARLLAPMQHGDTESQGRDGQALYLDRILSEPWWREGLGDWRVTARRVPADWAEQFGLHRQSMNPVMTARLMRTGRLRHRSPWMRGLYLAGGATHPGQWVSFCAISGILAARCVGQDLG